MFNDGCYRAAYQLSERRRFRHNHGDGSTLEAFPPPLSCCELEMRLPWGAFFFLFQRRLAETSEPRRLAPGPFSVSEQPSVSNRANLVLPGSASRRSAFSAGSVNRIRAPSAAGLPAGVCDERTRSRRFMSGLQADGRNRAQKPEVTACVETCRSSPCGRACRRRDPFRGVRQAWRS